MLIDAVCVAGHETTATTTAAALYCISAHPAVETRLLAELQAVLGDRSPGYADLDNLPYLQVSSSLSQCRSSGKLRSHNILTAC